jgi:hypothetical protein
MGKLTATEIITREAEAIAERVAAGEKHVQEVEAKRAADRRAFDRRAAASVAEYEEQEAAVRQAMDVTSDVHHRVERAARIAASDLGEFVREHRQRRDVAQVALERSLEAVPAALDAAVAGLANALSGPHTAATPQALAFVLGLERLRSPEAADTLRELVDGAAFSPLDSDEFNGRRRRAREHEEAIKFAGREVGEAAERLGKIRRALEESGHYTDPSPAAVAALDANEKAQAELRALRAALAGETNDEGSK